MSENNMSLNDSNNSVLFEVFPDLKEEDFDLLLMFLESRKQSGGGDIIDIESLTYDSLKNKNIIEINYEDVEARNRILNKKFFKFKTYYLKSYKPSIKGYKFDEYPLSKSKLIIKDLITSSESEIEDSIVRMYAEHLSPDNDIVQIEKSHLIPDMFYVTYKDNLDKNQLQIRYNKKSKLRNKQINLLDSFDTNSFLIVPSIAKQSSSNEIDQIKAKVIEEIEKRQTDRVVNYFVDINDNFILFQFENDTFLKDLMDSVKIFLQQKHVNFVIESCDNFEILSEISGVIRQEQHLESKSKSQNELKTKKFVEVGVQTDFQVQIINSTLVPNNNQFGMSQMIKNKNSLPSSIRSSFSEAESDNKNKFNSTNSLSSSSSLGKNSNSQTLGSDDSIIVLDPKEYYTIALLNTKQLFINFQADLLKIDKNLELSDKNQLKIINRKPNVNTQDWKLQVMLALNDFFTHRALYKTIKIPDEILKSQIYLETLIQTLIDWNKQSSAYYFRVLNEHIHCYGCKNVLNKKIILFNDLFKSIQSSASVIGKTADTQQSQVNKNSDKDLGLKENINKSNQMPTVLNSTYEIDQKSLSYLVLFNLKQLMNDFKNNLRQNLNSELLTQIDNKKMIINSTLKLSDPIEWTNKVKNFLTDFENNQVKKLKIEIPAHLKNSKETNDLKGHLKRFYDNAPTLKYELLQYSSIVVYGYTKAVNEFQHNILAKFKNLENNIRDRIKTKLDLKITSNKKPLEFIVLSQFKNKYFKEFQAGLSKFNASIETLNKGNNKNGFRVNCTLEQTKLKNEQIVESWRSKINSFMTEFFSRFSAHKVKASNLTYENLKADDSLINIVKLNSNEVEITGIKAEVNKAVNLLINSSKSSSNSKGLKSSSGSNLAQSNANSISSSSIKTNNEETFLINDLKWFQTRILFEKKYFQYVTEAFKDLKVLLDTQLTRIFFTGSKNDIEKAKTIAFDILKQILGAEVECDSITLMKMSQNENLHINLLKQNNLCCVIDSKSHKDRFTIYATNIEEIEKCKMILSAMKF